MIKILHCSDLHLSLKEKDYSFSVLDEIVSITNEHECDYLIFSGDIFDSFSDLEKLRSDFRKSLIPVNKKTVIYFIAGNHEEYDKGSNDILKFSLSDNDNFIVVNERPFKFIGNDNIEFLIIPFQKDYRDFLYLDIPEKKYPRIAIAHGTVLGMLYIGDEEESKVGTFDNEIFVKNKVDYAAMGHIHSGRKMIFGNTIVNYPGSARIWRKQEFGEHGVNLVTIDNGIKINFIRLKKSGIYREFGIPLSLNGDIELAHGLTDNWEENDWINLKLSGIVEDENNVVLMIKDLENKFSGKVRKFTIDMDRVEVLSGISSQMLVMNFLDIIDKKKDQFEYELWLKIREMGLREIKNIIEAKNDR